MQSFLEDCAYICSAVILIGRIVAGKKQMQKAGAIRGPRLEHEAGWKGHEGRINSGATASQSLKFTTLKKCCSALFAERCGSPRQGGHTYLLLASPGLRCSTSHWGFLNFMAGVPKLLGGLWRDAMV